jgi:hypothetical protein
LVGEAATFAARTESLTKNVFEALAELTAPEAVAVTAERITVNAGKAAEQCALSETKEVAKQGAKVSEALAEQVESKVPVSPKVALENEALLKNFNPSHYDPDIIGPHHLSKIVELFKDLPGAMSKDGPLKRYLSLTLDIIGDSIGKFNTAKGAAFELKQALQLEASGHKVVEFGKKVPLIDKLTNKIIKMLDIDIITLDKFIECKNLTWEKFSNHDFLNLKSKLIELQKVAQQNSKIFEFHSSNKIPEQLKIWLNENAIRFIESKL